MEMTRHALRRCNQRNVSKQALDVLLAFGRHRHYQHGAIAVVMDAAARAAAHRALGADYDRVARRLDLYAIVKDGHLLTVVERKRRMKFDALSHRRPGRGPRSRTRRAWSEA